KQDFIENLNPDSLEALESCKLEKCLGDATPETIYQFERLGYFCRDSNHQEASDSPRDHPVFNRTVTLRDAWAKLKKR
ncbi:MAG: glutamine--tRNA ligase, partial [Desulfobacula sp.]|nr:glutamine--tRNA ligase [Desulfobacula sp.]